MATHLRFSLALVASAALASGCFLFGGDSSSEQPDGGIGSSCETGDDCGGDLVCAAGTCQEPGSSGLGGPCWANRDCGPDLYCTPAGVCGRAGSGAEGDPCFTGADCLPELTCEIVGLNGGFCVTAGTADVGETCSLNADCLAGLVCAPDGTCQHNSVAFPPFLGVECVGDDSTQTFRPYFEVPRGGAPVSEFYRLPFPNDIRVSPAGELDMSGFPRPGPGFLGVDLVSRYLDAWITDFEGFGATVPIGLRFSLDIDFDTALPMLVDITAGAPEYNQTNSRSWLYRTAPAKYHCQNFFVIRPSPERALLPGHTYAAYLTTDIRSRDGLVPARDPDFDQMLSATRPGDADLGAAWDQYQPLRDYLGDVTVGVNPATVLIASVFTVADGVGRGKALADAALAAAPPTLSDLTLCDGAATSPCEEADGRGACSAVDADFFEIHGRVAVPFYQQGTPPFERLQDGGNIDFVAGVPQQAGTQNVCFALTIPKNAVMPAAGWPMVLAAHGTGGSFTSVVGNGVAKRASIAANPVATLSYDGVAHGLRRNGSTTSPDNLVFNIFNPRAARDNHAQGAVDIVYFMRLPELGLVTMPGAGNTQIDAANVFFFGHSQGGNVGIPAIAVTDQASGAIFSGAGSFLSLGLMTKTNPIDSKAALELVLEDQLSTHHPVIGVIQNLFTSVEVANYAPLLIARPGSIGLSAKNVWMSYGLGDTFSPPDTMGITARAMRLEVVEPVLEDISLGSVARPVSQNGIGGVFAAVFQAQPSAGDGHFVSTSDAQMIADWTAFLQSLIATGTATVP